VRTAAQLIFRSCSSARFIVTGRDAEVSPLGGRLSIVRPPQQGRRFPVRPLENGAAKLGSRSERHSHTRLFDFTGPGFGPSACPGFFERLWRAMCLFRENPVAIGS